MKNELNIHQRILVVLIYTIFFILLCHYFSGEWTYLYNSDSNYNLLFVSGALLLIFGTYIAEPFFTKPIDVITNSTAIILALLSINEPDKFIGYKYLFFSSALLGIISIIIIFLSNFKKIQKIQKIFFEIVTQIGKSQIVYSIIYILTLVSYFRNSPIEFIVFLTFWVIFVTKFVLENFVLILTKIFKFIFHYKNYAQILGEAISCENPFLYNVEIDYKKHKVQDTKRGELVYLSLENSQGAVGIIINEKQLLNKKWITIYLLEKDNAPIKIDLQKYEFISSSKNIFSKDNAVYKLELEEIVDKNSKKIIEENPLYKNKDRFIGYIAEGSDISKIRFHSLLDSTNEKYKLLKEGSVIKTEIYNEDVLYQIITGKTNEEELEKHNIYGYLTGIAQKLGKYDSGELKIVKWLPNIYAPVFFNEIVEITKNDQSIGKLPETNLEIILKDPNALITHNTAILGILGIGKSCLTFELIKKVIDNTKVKIVCLDITNEYKKELPNYIDNKYIQDNLGKETLEELKKKNANGTFDDPTTWGNEELYKNKLDSEFQKFTENSEKRVLILNPDWHSVSKAGSAYKIQYKIDLTIAEKTRLISERLFILSKNEWEKMKTEEQIKNEAKFLLVFEEAHSLIPEWNSTANTVDQSASNGTAKVILQGRKYGFGSFVVTQRTANISKSILNQCNTIFALRVFDDTGKQFLENYIGSDYSSTLPTLEDRHAIAVGKALKLSQPVIIRLNEKDEIIKK